MKTVTSFYTLVKTFQSTWCLDQGGHNMNIHHSENIKSNSVTQLYTCDYSDLTIQPPIQCIMRSLSQGAKLATVIHPIPRLTMCGAITPLPHMPSWGAEEQQLNSAGCLSLFTNETKYKPHTWHWQVPRNTITNWPGIQVLFSVTESSINYYSLHCTRLFKVTEPKTKFSKQTYHRIVQRNAQVKYTCGWLQIKETSLVLPAKFGPCRFHSY